MRSFFERLSLVFLFFITAPLGWAQVSVKVDFEQKMDFPLVKTKFSVYQTPLAGIDRLLRDIPLLGALNAPSLRFETGWGKNEDFNAPQISGSANNLVYNREDYTAYIKSVVENGAEPLITHSYCPVPLQPAGDWRDKPNNLTAWERINRDYASHWRSQGIRKSSFEVWNEPDLDIFFNGTKSDYFQIYQYGSRGIRAGNPDAKIGGPVTAFIGWYNDFLNYVRSNNLPLDFLSGHAYANASWQIDAMRSAIGSNRNWREVEIFLTEYASYATVPNTDIKPGGAIEKFVAAADFLKDAKMLLNYPDLTRVYWAMWSDTQWLDHAGNWFLPTGDKMGFVDVTGKTKAIYYAFKIYNQLPVDRNPIVISGTGIDAMAASDLHNAGLVVWSEHDTESSLNLNLDNLPFSSGIAELYRIDAEHSSFFENKENDALEMVETIPVEGGAFQWEGLLPAKGTLYIKMVDGSGISELTPNKFATVIRTHHWFPDRGNTQYADFDAATGTARLGMGTGNEYATAQIAFTVEDIPEKLNVDVFTEGNLKNLDKNSVLGLRIDYQDVQGTYATSVIFHGGLFNADRDEALPWGQAGLPDNVVELETFSSFVLDVKEYAPAGFRGRAIISFIMQNTGRNTRSKIKLTAASDEIIPMEQLVVTSIKNDIEPKGLSVKAYPNPVKEFLELDVFSPNPSEINMVIMDVSGKVMHTGPQEYIHEKTKVFIDTKDWRNGLYFLKINSHHGEQQNLKILVEH